MDSLGKRLGRIRRDKDMTQRDLSEMAGVPVSTLRGYEQGLRTPQLKILAKLCQALKIRPEALDPDLSPENDQRTLLMRKLAANYDGLSDEAKTRISEIIDECLY